jgi:protein-disulfide isomerase
VTLPGATHHVLVSAIVLALVLAAFAGGWWMGRAGRLDVETGTRLARLEAQVEELRAQRGPASGAGPAAGAARVADSTVHPIDAGDAPALGPADAAVTIVEFADFECPYCASAEPTLERLLAEYGGKVRLVFKHNPLPGHKNALLAHRAAVAAGRQGRFWEMHDLLYASQEMLDRETLKSHARTLGLDLVAFEAFLASPESTQAVSADMSQAGKLGIKGAPAFFINGRFLPGAQPIEVFREVIDQELQAGPSERP